MILCCSLAPKSTLVFFPPRVTMLIFDIKADSGSRGSILIKFSPLRRLRSSHLAISYGKSSIACVLNLQCEHQGLLVSEQSLAMCLS